MVTEAEQGLKMKDICDQEQARKDRKVHEKMHLIKGQIYKRLDLGEFELYESVEAPHTTLLLLLLFFQKHKAVIFWQLVNTVFGAKGQDVS